MTLHRNMRVGDHGRVTRMGQVICQTGATRRIEPFGQDAGQMAVLVPYAVRAAALTWHSASSCPEANDPRVRTLAVGPLS